MGKNLKNQLTQKIPFWTDEETHRLFSAFAADQGRKINAALKDVIYSNSKFKRFLIKYTAPTQPSAQ
jgi:hypothetical protein